MSRKDAYIRLARRVNHLHELRTMARTQVPHDPSVVVYVDGPLRRPIGRELRHTVRGLLRRGERYIVLDLARVPRIDAAGVGELVRAYNMTAAVNGALRIVSATTWVRWILERVRLFELLSAAGPGGVTRRRQEFSPGPSRSV